MAFQPTHQLKLYRNFKAIEATDYYEIIRYFERHEDAIQTLDFPAYFDCTARYTEALFQTDAFGKHLVMVNHLLHLIIENNVDTHDGQDVYVFTLLRKGTSQFLCKQYQAAEHTLRETIKIAPWERYPPRLLRRVLVRQTPFWLKQVRLIALIGVLLAVFFRTFTYLILQPYFPALEAWADVMYHILLAGGLGTWILAESIHYGSCATEVIGFVQKMLRKKLTK